jgi:hypothetical protein
MVPTILQLQMKLKKNRLKNPETKYLLAIKKSYGARK